MQGVTYYIPEIEEFCVGFECEHLSYKRENEELKEVWTKINISLHNFDSESYENVDILSNWRVKYLDKEDIESLTFVFYKKFPVNYMEEICYTFHSEELNLMLGFYPKSSVISFATKDPSKNRVFLDTSVDPNRINMVKVKNKSEFKKLLKQLDINIIN